MRPNFGVDDVLMAVDDLYGFQCEARELPSYSDQNFLITRDDGVKFVFKVANDEEPTEVLQFQQNVLMHLQKSDLSNQCPRVIAMVDGQRLGSMGQPSTHHTHPVWMVSFLDGKFMSKLPEYSRACCTIWAHSSVRLTESCNLFSIRPCIEIYHGT